MDEKKWWNMSITLGPHCRSSTTNVGLVTSNMILKRRKTVSILDERVISRKQNPSHDTLALTPSQSISLTRRPADSEGAVRLLPAHGPGALDVAWIAPPIEYRKTPRCCYTVSSMTRPERRGAHQAQRVASLRSMKLSTSYDSTRGVPLMKVFKNFPTRHERSSDFCSTYDFKAPMSFVSMIIGSESIVEARDPILRLAPGQ